VGERIFAIFEPVNGGLTSRSPVALLDLQEGQEREPVPWSDRISEGAEAVVDWSLDHVVDPYLAELRRRRRREWRLRRTAAQASILW